MVHTKAFLRRHYNAQRRQLQLQQMHEMLAAMLQWMPAISWPEASVYMSYQSMAKHNEVPVHFFEEWLEAENENLQWCYPKTNAADCSMEAMLQDENLHWHTSSFGVEEPVAGTLVNPADISLVLVPLIAFDEKGYRVGYGKGFYDRFLKRCAPSVVTVGLSWFPPVPIIADIDANDVPLKYCITPQQFYAF